MVSLVSLYIFMDNTLLSSSVSMSMQSKNLMPERINIRKIILSMKLMFSLLVLARKMEYAYTQ